MKTNQNNSVLLRILCMVFMVAMVLFTTGCSQQNDTDYQPTTTVYEDGAVIGNGEKQFTLTVVDRDKNEVTFTVNTDSETVGGALIENNVISGEEGDYGMYIKEVNGILADYDVNKVYWAFYANGEYAVNSAELTEIENGAAYRLKVEK